MRICRATPRNGSSRSDQGTFVAKVNPAQLSVLDYLSERHFPHAPALLRTSDGASAARIGDKVVSMLGYLPRTVDDSGSPADAWRLLGEAAARLNAHHDFTLPFAVQLDCAIDELARRVAGQPFEDQFLELLGRAAGVTSLAADALVHGEINPANARRRADGTVVLVDWDEVGMAPAAIEYGYPLINVFLSESDLTFDDRSASAFYETYARAGGAPEARALFDAALFHALRYMWWETPSDGGDDRARRVARAPNCAGPCGLDT